MNVAYLYSQLEIADDINNERLNIWQKYYERLKPLKEAGLIELPYIPAECEHNGHMFYIKVKDLKMRTELMNDLNRAGIKAIFHYVPLHTAQAGLKFGEFIGEDVYTTKESDRLLRLPMYYGLQTEQIDYIVDQIKEFFKFKTA
jgi:dTDP-4-amino-4,6-dideoxygalactose transaminase